MLGEACLDGRITPSELPDWVAATQSAVIDLRHTRVTAYRTELTALAVAGEVSATGSSPCRADYLTLPAAGPVDGPLVPVMVANRCALQGAVRVRQAPAAMCAPSGGRGARRAGHRGSPPRENITSFCDIGRVFGQSANQPQRRFLPCGCAADIGRTATAAALATAGIAQPALVGCVGASDTGPGASATDTSSPSATDTSTGPVASAPPPGGSPAATATSATSQPSSSSPTHSALATTSAAPACSTVLRVSLEPGSGEAGSAYRPIEFEKVTG